MQTKSLLDRKVLPESWCNTTLDFPSELAPPLTLTFEAVVMFARTKVIIPGPEVTHTISRRP